MANLTDCTDEELLDELTDRVNLADLMPAPGAAGLTIPGVPDFVINLIKAIGAPKALNIVVQLILDGKAHGWGKALPVGGTEKIGSGAHGRGGEFDVIAIKTGDSHGG